MALAEAASLSERPPRFVVGLGASAGGLEALERFFAHTPSDSGAAFVVVMHLSRDFKSVLDELLARQTKMPVRPIVDGMRLAENTVYVIQPSSHIEVGAEFLKVTPRPITSAKQRLSSIDVLFRSLADNWGEKCAVVVLSGSGSDGSHGVVSVHESGGAVFAQAPETAKFDSMPVAAIATSRVSGVETPEALPQLVLEGLQLPKIFDAAQKPHSSVDALQQILGTMVGAAQVDASQYTQSIFQRRLQRRMRELQIASLAEYSDRVKLDTNEARALSEALLIGVTDFFRDDFVFAHLEQNVMPELIRRAHEEQRQIKIWVVGCATGEEAYSLAMLLEEAAADFPHVVNYQIFATDVHRGLLSAAARGEFTSEQLQNISEVRLRTFFSPSASGVWQIDPKLRKSIIFAPHDVLADAPFTRLDMVSCRNLLIYFSIEAQQRVLASFAFGLLERGFLVLGSSESVGSHRETFEFVDVRRRIFRRSAAPARRTNFAVARQLDWPARSPTNLSRRRAARARELELLPAYDALINQYAPPSFLVNSTRELLHVFGAAKNYLKPPEGAVSFEVSQMLDRALRTLVTAGVERAFREKAAITFEHVELQEAPDAGRFVDVTVQPLVDEEGQCQHALVQMKESRPLLTRSIEPTALVERDEEDHRVAELEIELMRTREALQATIEEIETANEELQATNEQLLSANEELQSTNEELSSLNEELHSVNAEHFRQNDELLRLTRDFAALLHATEIGVIFFDEELKIRRFTSLVGELFQFTDSDVNRRLSTFRSPFLDFDLESFLARILRAGKTEEMETRDAQGRGWLLRAAGYPDQKGVVLSVISIVRRHNSQDPQIAEKERLLAFAAPYAGDPVIVVVPETGYVDYANDAALLRMGVTDAALATGLHASRLTPEWGDDAWISWLSTIDIGKFSSRLDVPVFDSMGKIFVADLRAAIVKIGDAPRAVVRLIENRERAKELREYRELSRAFAQSNRELENFASVVAHDLRAPLRHMNQFAGFLSEELGGTASPNVTECLGIIQSSAVSMSAMVESLLEYARIGANGPAFEEIELNVCVEQAALLLRTEFAASNGKLKPHYLGKIRGDRALMTRLFQNLFLNALNYRRPDVAPVIEVSRQDVENATLIRVADNGVGVDPQHAETIFKMFHRLHRDRDSGGHGMGLAICRRVCEIHGARITLDAAFAQGACFEIEFPNNLREPDEKGS